MNKLTNDYVSAFVDGELSHKEVDDFFKVMGEDRQVADAACELCTLKLMVRHAYEDKLDYKPKPRSWFNGNLNRAIAATLILGLGSLVGWKLNEEMRATPAANNLVREKPMPDGFQPVSLKNVAPTESNNVIYHVDSNKPDQVRSALRKVSETLKEDRARGIDQHVEVLVNYRGLDMLRIGLSTVSREIGALAAQYPDKLKFVACGQSIERFKREGEIIQLLPGVEVAPSAIGEIVGRLKQGWTYIKV